ncbi:hypothetical protein DPQ33_16005 [Oceanidesulfovibrio indonesiensis]|uniref:Uncharacterized protein n=2 Tax=Oceanidesulfovibrio indonesiensis TaxID=54767 RepID=A0A7M3MBS2_9BACT|nr:hypothetical protein DPQ33_16005 [Oceanidesulfovibrio indonesiensis]
MRLLHLQSILSIRTLAIFVSLASLLFVFGAPQAHAETTNQQVERAWNNLRSTACANARSMDRTEQAASRQHSKMEQVLRRAQNSENIPQDVLRATIRSMQNALRDMAGIVRDVRSISRDMARICSEDIRLRNIRDAAKQYDERRQDINAAAGRFNVLRDEYTEAIKDFNEAATELAIHGFTLNQLETEK